MTNFFATSPTRSVGLMDSRVTRTQSALLSCLRAYQLARAGRFAPCRFYPSCSAYAVEAVEVHGAGRGLMLAMRRVSRCHPFGSHGVDLVPVRKKDR